MATINLGRIKPIWQGAWTGSTAYVKDDIVRYGVDSYICTTAHTSDASTFANDSANWELMAQGSDLPSQSGNAGLALKTDGTNLSWGQAGGMVPIFSTYNSNVNAAAVDVDNIFTDDYTAYVFHMSYWPINNANDLRVRLLTNGTQEGGAGYRSVTGGLEAYSSGANDAQARYSYNQNEWQFMPAGGGIGNGSAQGGIEYTFEVRHPRTASTYPRVLGNYVCLRGDDDNNLLGGNVAGISTNAHSNAYTGMRFYSDNGNVGRFYLAVFGVEGS
jgi:hypothetical protein